MAFLHIKYTALNSSKSMEETRVPETVKDGTDISKISKLFPCSSKSLLNLRVSSTRFPINLFLINMC